MENKMYNVYTITNKINGMRYVGKTSSDLKKRLLEHIKDSKSDRCKNRDLYKAFNKFGIDNFYIELIGSFSKDVAFKKEIEYIKKYDTFDNGYNMTMGTDSKKTIDVDSIIKLYKQYKSISMVSRVTHHSKKQISKILKKSSVTVLSSAEVSIMKCSKPILQIDKYNGDIIKRYNSASVASRELGNLNYRRHISTVCTGKRKSAYGYKWRFAE